MFLYLIMLVLQGYTASYLYLDDAVFYIFTVTAERRFSTSFEYVVNIQFFFFFLFIPIKCNNWSTTNKLSKTVNINQHVNSTHNRHINASVSKPQPICQLNTQPTRQCISQYTSTNMSTQHTANTSMHQSVHVNKHVNPTRQSTCQCVSQ